MRPPSNITAVMTAGIKNLRGHSHGHSHENARENARVDSRERAAIMVSLCCGRISVQSESRQRVHKGIAAGRQRIDVSRSASPLYSFVPFCSLLYTEVMTLPLG